MEDVLNKKMLSQRWRFLTLNICFWRRFKNIKFLKMELMEVDVWGWYHGQIIIGITDILAENSIWTERYNEDTNCY